MMKPAAQRDATAANEQQKLDENILKHQADVDVRVSRRRGAKPQTIQEPRCLAQQRRAADTVKEVAETQTTSAQSPAERKLAEQLSHEDVTSEESNMHSFTVEIEHTRRLEPSKESELESSKESDTARVADVKIDSSTIFKSRQVVRVWNQCSTKLQRS